MYRKTFYYSLVIALLYVGLGTMSVFCLYPPYYADWVIVTLMITLPVSIISFGLIYGGAENLLIIGVQFIMLLLTWRFVYYCLKRS